MHKGERETQVERRRRRQFLGGFSPSYRDQAWFKKKKEEPCKRLSYGNLTKTHIFLFWVWRKTLALCKVYLDGFSSV